MKPLTFRSGQAKPELKISSDKNKEKEDESDYDYEDDHYEEPEDSVKESAVAPQQHPKKESNETNADP